jgi:tripartite-type tricarboxylate transporter receptor subunit TctC
MRTTPTLTRRDCLRVVASGAATLALPAFAAYPEKPIRIVVTFAAGGASDIVARVVGEQLGKKLGQAVIVDNRPGAGGSVGGTNVVQSPADGYTLMLSNSTPVSIGPFALEKQPYDPLADFTHIASIGTAPCVVMANPAAGINTIVDLENAARKAEKAGAVMQFGSGGPASIGHIYGELMVRNMGIKMTHVPYRGGAPMTTDLISGIIPIGIDVVTAFVPYFKSGQIRPLSVTSAQRSPLVPDVPTVLEHGYRKLVLDNFFGLSGPAKMPADLVAQINKACNEVLAQPDIVKRLLELGVTTTPGTSAAFNGFVKEHPRHPLEHRHAHHARPTQRRKRPRRARPARRPLRTYAVDRRAGARAAAVHLDRADEARDGRGAE